MYKELFTKQTSLLKLKLRLPLPPPMVTRWSRSSLVKFLIWRTKHIDSFSFFKGIGFPFPFSSFSEHYVAHPLAFC